MATENNANIGFEKQIWDATCVLWGHIPAAEQFTLSFLVRRRLIDTRCIHTGFSKEYGNLRCLIIEQCC